MAQKYPSTYKRNELDPRMRVISDTLDEFLARCHGILATSWAEPELFLEWLEERGYTVVKQEAEVFNAPR